MCCGSGVKKAASRQYVLPPKKGETEPQVVTYPIDAPPPSTVPDYPLYKRPGAYYGNPVPKKKKV